MKRLLKALLPENFRAKTRIWRGKLITILAQRTNFVRDPLSFIFLRGEGVEIGALNWPLPVASDARVSYVDRATAVELKALYPELRGIDFPVDIVGRIESLSAIETESKDFVIANHVIEHSENPILAIKTLFRILKPSGILFLTLPDKRFTFDLPREITPFEHVVKDYREGPEWSRLDHYRDSIRTKDGITDPEEIEVRAKEMAGDLADIHFHVWDQAAMLEFLLGCRQEISIDFDVEVMSRTGLEVIFVLRKI